MPNGEKITTTQSKVSKLSPSELERGYWKGWFKGITPGMIKEFINDHLTQRAADLSGTSLEKNCERKGPQGG